MFIMLSKCQNVNSTPCILRFLCLPYMLVYPYEFLTISDAEVARLGFNGPSSIGA